eukprot:3590962-Alexandrium_andersonii.AAC.1
MAEQGLRCGRTVSYHDDLLDIEARPLLEVARLDGGDGGEFCPGEDADREGGERLREGRGDREVGRVLALHVGLGGRKGHVRGAHHVLCHAVGERPGVVLGPRGQTAPSPRAFQHCVWSSALALELQAGQEGAVGGEQGRGLLVEPAVRRIRVAEVVAAH